MQIRGSARTLFRAGVLSLPMMAAAGALAAEAATVPVLAPDRAPEWALRGGSWSFQDGVLAQADADGMAVALLKAPALADFALSLEFRILPVGDGVRAAAIAFRATGTMTYYWCHLDSKNGQVILVQSTPQESWREIARRRCAIGAGDWHAARIECRGARVTVSMDGNEVLTADDTVLAAGRVGVGTSQGRVEYRNLRIEGALLDGAAPLRDETPPPPLYQVISRGAAAGPYQAFPDACRLANGDILCVFYAGYGHVSLPSTEWPNGGRICMVRSSDEGRTWTAPEVLYDDADDNRDPHVAQMRDGSLVCSFFSLAMDAGKRVGRGAQLVYSRDGGRTWDRTAQTICAGYYCSAPVRELADGTRILGVYSEGTGKAWGGVLRSSDHGKTWSAPIDIGREAELYLDAETDVIQRTDGSLYAALRSSRVHMHYATSSDGGQTWTPAQDIGFSGHAPHFTRLRSGEILMTHRVPHTALHVSRDECRTWSGPYVMDRVGGAYPATVELRDGSVLAIYYTEGAGSHVRAQRFRLLATGIELLATPQTAP